MDESRADPAREADAEQALLVEAADWVVLLQSGEATGADHEALARWRAGSAAHEAAWQRAEAVLGCFGQVPSALGRDTLQRLPSPGRRQAFRALGLLLVASPVLWLSWRQLPWREWRADLRTATGEQRSLTLADGTRLVLNTDTAVDVAFTADARRLRLWRGEVLVSTGRDPSPSYRPFIVETGQGVVRALGTRFNVRQLDDRTRVDVYEHAVELRPRHGQPLVLPAGFRAELDDHAAHPPLQLGAAEAFWPQGVLLAQNMPLAALVDELRRYHHGLLRVHPEVAGLPVSGAFPVTDTMASLDLLEQTLPLRIGRLGSFWASIGPR